MARLLDLPDEMLLEVLLFVYHEDIEALTSCCKRLNGVGREVRDQHFDRKHNYGTIVCGDVMADGTPTIHPLRILQHMINDEILFSYPTKMIIVGCSADRPEYHITHAFDEDLREAYEKTIGEISETMPDVLRRSPYFGHEEVEQDPDLILSGVIEPVIALLLTILPNIQCIELRNYTGSMGIEIESMLLDIAKMNASLPNMRHALHELSSVYMYGGDTEGEGHEYEILERLQPYIGLPSLRYIGGRKVTGLPDAHIFPWYRWDESLFGTEITSIDFTHSMIEAECFKYILSRVEGLRDFRYEYDNRLPEYLASDRREAIGWWEPRGIIEVLLKHASHSLVSLDLTGSANAPAGSYYAGASFVDSLRGFKMLEKLRIDNELFIESRFEEYVAGRNASWNYSISSPEQEEIDARRRTGQMQEDKNKWNFAETQVRYARLIARFNKQTRREKCDRVHRCVDVLPASLVELRLCMPFHKGALDLMFAQFVSLKESRLPNLKRVALEDVYTVKKDPVKTFQMLGIELEYQRLNVESP